MVPFRSGIPGTQVSVKTVLLQETDGEKLMGTFEASPDVPGACQKGRLPAPRPRIQKLRLMRLVASAPRGSGGPALGAEVAKGFRARLGVGPGSVPYCVTSGKLLHLAELHG